MTGSWRAEVLQAMTMQMTCPIPGDTGQRAAVQELTQAPDAENMLARAALSLTLDVQHILSIRLAP